MNNCSLGGMKPAEFRQHGKEMVDYIVDYLENIHRRRVVPAIEPALFPTVFEHSSKCIDAIDTGNSFPSILADMISDALGCMGFSWAACPAMTELEIIMLDWFGKMIGLPPFETFGAYFECNFVSLLAARFEVLKELRQRFPFVEEGLLMSKLVAYCSKEVSCTI
uniref:Uncharacterized protein n=1 Tax=Parascaris equorum TaxID=6256 RepID=A0A914R5Z8_PAREQ